jgi:hypothetical protein
MKRFRLRRFWQDGERTLGELSCDELFVCFILEPGDWDEDHPRVRAGFYLIERHNSSRFPDTFALVGQHVSHYPEEEMERNAVLIHAGNRDDDTSGCLIPGDSIGRLQGETAVLSSANALARIRDEIGSDQYALLTITEGPSRKYAPAFI